MRNLLTLSALILTVTACAKDITVPAADRSPPVVSLHVFGAGNPVVLEAGGSNVSRSVPDGGTLALVGVAEDKNGGVKNIRIDGTGKVHCKRGNVGQLTFIHYIAQNPEDDTVGVGDTAKTRRATSMELKIASLKALCQGEFTFSSAEGGFTATGSNFHPGGTVTTPLFSFSTP